MKTVSSARSSRRRREPSSFSRMSIRSHSSISTPGHTLVVPKKHYPSMVEMPPAEVGRVFVSVAKVMKGVMRASKADGINIGQSNGRAASQEVFHMHVHVIPRYIHELPEGFPERKTASTVELEQISRKIKAAIEP